MTKVLCDICEEEMTLVKTESIEPEEMKYFDTKTQEKKTAIVTKKRLYRCDNGHEMPSWTP